MYTKAAVYISLQNHSLPACKGTHIDNCNEAFLCPHQPGRAPCCRACIDRFGKHSPKSGKGLRCVSRPQATRTQFRKALAGTCIQVQSISQNMIASWHIRRPTSMPLTRCSPEFFGAKNQQIVVRQKGENEPTWLFAHVIVNAPWQKWHSALHRSFTA